MATETLHGDQLCQGAEAVATAVNIVCVCKSVTRNPQCL